MYSEMEERRRQKYVNKLVRSMPRWIKELFAEEKIFFQLDEHGYLALAAKPEVSQGKRLKAAEKVYNYIDHNPTDSFKVLEVQ